MPSDDAGAFYAYIARGLGKPAGIGSAWVALVSYNAMQVGIYGMFGFAASSFLETTFALVVPWWATALAGWVIGRILVAVGVRATAAWLAAGAAVIVALDVTSPPSPRSSASTFATNASRSTPLMEKSAMS